MISLLDQYIQKYNQINLPQKSEQEQSILRTNVRAYKPSGHIIPTHTLSLRDAFDSDKRSIRYFKDGINGHGNDYSIGKINDLTIKLGSLGIAGLIATGKGSPLQKSMEFLGLASWLGAMSLWPKLAINAPIKKLKGIDLNSEYITSSGHRKSFYQDPQFICWDMISDKEMNQIADKLNIPKDIKNRRKATENKARQIAIQGNTLALLSAGVATPLIASLAADQLGKHVLTPALEKYQELRADSLGKSFSKQVLEKLADYKLDAKADEVIEKHVKQSMGPADIEAIRKLFAGSTKDIAMENVTNATLSNIFKVSDIDSYKIPVTSELKENIAKLIVMDVPNKTYSPAQLVNDLLQSGNNTITSENLYGFIGGLTEELETKYSKNISLANRKQIIKSVKEYLMSQRVITLISQAETKEKLKQMALMSQVYHKHYFCEFRNKYAQYTFGNELSTQAHIWREMPKKLLKILKINSTDMKALLASGADTATSTKILYTAFEKIISDPIKYEKAMKELGEFAKRMNTINDKFLPNALDYLDGLTDMFANSPYKQALSDYSSEIKNLLRAKRVEILTKYIGTDVTLYAPIRALSVLKTSKGELQEIAKNSGIKPDELYDAIKNIMFNFQTTDAFVNKLQNLKELIKSDEDFKIVLRMVFDKLPHDVENIMPKGLADRINDTTTLLKGLLLNLSDDVNFRFGPAKEDKVIRAVKNLDLYKYINDLFFTGFNDKDAIIRNIMQTISENPEKSDILQSIFRLTKEELAEVMQGNNKPIYNNTYFNNALYKARDMFMLFGSENLKDLGEISIGKTKMCQSSKAMGKTINNLIKDAGQEMLNYKSWFTKVGIAFVALAGLTAYGISQIGKKNEFNPDKYIERSKS